MSPAVSRVSSSPRIHAIAAQVAQYTEGATVTTALCLLIAILLDKLLGEPRRLHPLVGFGRLVQRVEQQLYPQPPQTVASKAMRLRGLLAVALLLLPPTLCAAWLVSLPYIGLIAQTLLLYLAIGATSLAQHARAIAEALQQHDLPLARYRVSMIVSRDTAQLDEQAICRATIESVLENGADAIFSAIFWFLLLGAPGVVLYRLANTLDAMWGYRNQRYLHFGWAAARFDDVLNYLPARLTALTYTLLGHVRHGWLCWRTQAPTWYSPNAGPVMAAGAGALGIQLGGSASYHGQNKERPVLGMGRPAQTADITRAIALLNRSLWLWVLLALLTGGLAHA
jgi:adenosylcobinamide-phosphate synthase